MDWQWGSGKEHGGEASICAAMGNPSLHGASLGVTHSVSGNSSSCLVSKPNKLKGSQSWALVESYVGLSCHWGLISRSRCLFTFPQGKDAGSRPPV